MKSILGKRCNVRQKRSRSPLGKIGMKDKKGQLYILAALIIGVVVFWAISPSNTFTAREVNPDFQDISRNYDEEARRLINDMLEDKVDKDELSLRLAAVSDEFIYRYAKKRDPEFGVVFVLTDGNVIDIVNYLDKSVKVGDEIVGGKEEICVKGSVNLAGFSFDTSLTNYECEELLNDETLEKWIEKGYHVPTTARLTLDKSEDGGTTNGKDIEVKKEEFLVGIEGAIYKFSRIEGSIQLNVIARREEDGQVQIYVSD